jgi:sortase B
MKHLGKSRTGLILHILMALCVLGFLYSAFVLFTDSQEDARGNAAYQQLRLKQEEQTNGVDFTSLERINPDVVGWLAVEGTEIDYPVVQGKDNDFYLRHLFTGERNKLGSIFMNYRNHSNFSDKNTIIYGHH